MTTRNVVAVYAVPVLASFALASLAFAGTKHSIGSFGASIELDRNWTRRTLDADLGDDQFVGSRSRENQFFVTIEVEALLDLESDFESQLREFMAGVGNDFHAYAFDFERRGELGVASYEFDAKVSGLDIAYSLRLVGRESLGYLVMAWAGRSKRSSIEREADAIANALRFPGRNSEWGRSCVPTEHTARLRGHTIRFLAKDSVFSGTPAESDAFLALSSPEEEVNLFLLGYEQRGTLDGVLDDVGVAVGESWVVEELRRESVQLGGREARQACFRLDDGRFELLAVAVGLADDLFLDVRYLVEPSLDDRAAHRDMIFESFTIEGTTVADAFPEPRARANEVRLPETKQALIDASRELGSANANAHVVTPTPSGWLLVGGNSIEHFVRDGSAAEPVVSALDWVHERSAAFVGDELWFTSDAGVERIVRGTRQPAELDAACLAATPDGLVLVRAPETRYLPGVVDERFRIGASVVLRRDARGREEPCGDLASGIVRSLGVTGDGAHALLVFSAVEREFGAWRVPLTVLDLSSGASRDVAGWSSVQSIASAPDGWLVSGAPADGPGGVWLLHSDGTRELLVSGGLVRGFGLDADGQLVFASPWGASAAQNEEGLWIVREVPVAVARELGVRCEPLYGRLIREIALRAFESTGMDASSRDVFASGDDVSRFLAAADRATRDAVGVGLPHTTDEVDALVNALSADTGSGHEGLLLLTALLSGRLMEEGARWVPGDDSRLGRLGFRDLSELDNDFAYCILPADVVASTGMEESSWWSPAQSILYGSEGRTILLGTDPTAIAAAAAELDQDGWLPRVASSSPADVMSFLDEHARNVFARKRVYRELATLGRLAELTRIAGALARRTEPAMVDRLAWLGCRVANHDPGGEGGDGAALVRDLRDAVADHPDEAPLYVLLGQVYERAGTAASLPRAVACFERASELAYWGPEADYAAEALERLAGQ